MHSCEVVNGFFGMVFLAPTPRESEISNFKFQIGKEDVGPREKGTIRSRVRFRRIGAGHWPLIDQWPLGIGHWPFVRGFMVK